MKKKVMYSIIVTLLLFTSLNSFSQAYKKGFKQFNAGVGLLFVGAYASAEFGVDNNIGVGPIVGYTYYNTGLLSGYYGDYGYGQYRVGARGAYHLGETFKIKDDKIDPYIALSIGVVVDRTDINFNANTLEIEYNKRVLPFFNPRFGAAMELTQNLKAYVELGYGGSWMQGGIAFKF
ncbi:hypothetical protein [Arcicella rigui]|uniref:Outer membrane protein beta-barrel domain-containing protein n=1 Tax=Arcicella rigui TaxID=797020 RepID=A0ABU5Q8H9_9BACT|nr:hypothetical protein [Arcicella rigui]MEA5138882.1 hypothetical protein [Arcicella rigui]